jgi:hypothetical protein
MKYVYTKCILLISLLFSFISTCYAEGFGVGTLVKISGGYRQIEQLCVGDRVICYDSQNNEVESIVIYIAKKSVDHYVRMKINDEIITIAHDQRVYDIESNSWVLAAELQQIHIDLIDDTVDVYLTGVAKHHNFLVTQSDICVHNFVPAVVIVISIAIGSGGLEIAGLTCGLAGLGTFLGYKWHKSKQGHNIVIEPEFYANSMMPEDPEDEKKRKRDQARMEYKPLTNKEARAKAKQLGYRETKDHPCGNTYDEPVFFNGKNYISPDRTGHRGGDRLATANIDLTTFIGT